MSANTELQTYSRYSEFKRGTSNKFYQIEVQELEGGRASFLVRYGRIGATPREKCYGTHYNFRAACSKAETLFGKKLTKGYREATALEALASAIEEPNQRKNNGLAPVTLDLPLWDSGSPETNARLDKLAQAAVDKLNLIRASYNGMSATIYRKQIKDVVRSLQAEFSRISNTRLHGPYIVNNHRIQAKTTSVLSFLRENAGIRILW